MLYMLYASVGREQYRHFLILSYRRAERFQLFIKAADTR